MFSVQCPTCKTVIKVPTEFMGKRATCKKCRQVLQLPSAPPAKPAEPPRKASASSPLFNQPTVATPSRPDVPVVPGTPVASGQPDSLTYTPTVILPKPEMKGTSTVPPAGTTPPRAGSRFMTCALLSFFMVSLVVCLVGGGIGGYVYWKSRGDKSKYGKYAVIEIGSSDVKVILIDLTKDGDSYDFSVPLKDTNKTLLAEGANEQTGFAEASVNRTADGVKAFHKLLIEKHKVPEDRIFIVGNRQSLFRSMKDNEKTIADAKAKLSKVVQEHTGKEMEWIDNAEEIRLETLAIIPPNETEKAMIIDIGSSSIKGGYPEPNGKFAPLESKFGVRSYARKLKEEADAQGTTPGAISDRTTEKEVVPDLEVSLQIRPQLKSRSKVYLLGGGSWAMATYVHPEDRSGKVPISAHDIEHFEKMLYKKDTFRAPEDPKLIRERIVQSIADPDLKKEVAEEISKVQEAFARDVELIAAAELLKALSKVLGFEGKQIRFYRDGQYAPALGFALKKSGVEK